MHNTLLHARFVRLFGASALLGLAAILSSPSALADLTLAPADWFTSNSNGGATAGANLQFGDLGDGTNTLQHAVAYFTPAGQPVSLSQVGDSLSLSLSFSVQVRNPSNPSKTPVFGFGFYNSGNSRVSADGLGVSNAIYAGYRGYRVGVRPATDADNSTPFELRARSADSNTLVSGTAHATVIGAGGTPSTTSALASNAQYNVTYSITRTGADTLSIAFSLTGNNVTGYSQTWESVAATYISFDTFALSLGNSNTFNSITINDVSLTTSLIPEPRSVAALLGLGMLGFVAFMRRR